MDGNGRWAKERGLPRIKGHEQGATAVRELVRAAGELGVEFVTAYAFSTENWTRPKAEVAALMELLERFLKDKRGEMIENNIRLDAIGRLDDLPKACRRELKNTMEATAACKGVTFIMALSYSGRAELVDAAKAIARASRDGSLDPETITESTLADALYTKRFPDPDLLIRTSGEMRLSNFLLWQISYAELWVTQKLWPDFNGEDLVAALEEFGRRQRRYGGL